MDIQKEQERYGISKGLCYNTQKPIILVDFENTIASRDTNLAGIINRWASQIGKEFGIYDKYLFNYRIGVIGGRMHNTVSPDIIYREIAEQCVYFGILDSEVKEEFIRRCHEVELMIETKAQSAIVSTVDFLKLEKAQGKKIYCVSDFRLPSTDLTRFLGSLGCVQLFDGVFSSCDFGCTKKDGNLYPLILQEISASADDCIMIGDNLKSDCINASKNGISACWLN